MCKGRKAIILEAVGKWQVVEWRDNFNDNHLMTIKNLEYPEIVFLKSAIAFEDKSATERMKQSIISFADRRLYCENASASCALTVLVLPRIEVRFPGEKTVTICLNIGQSGSCDQEGSPSDNCVVEQRNISEEARKCVLVLGALKIGVCYGIASFPKELSAIAEKFIVDPCGRGLRCCSWNFLVVNRGK